MNCQKIDRLKEIQRELTDMITDCLKEQQLQYAELLLNGVKTIKVITNDYELNRPKKLS